MKAKYTPGTPDNKVGKTYNVEVLEFNMAKVPHITEPIIKSVRIKYEDGKKEWIDGMKFFSDIRDNKSFNKWVY